MRKPNIHNRIHSPEYAVLISTCTPRAIQRSQHILLSKRVKRSTDFNAVFTVRSHPRPLINVATLPCESETVIMRMNINSVFNVNYEIAINASNCIDSLIKCHDESYK